MTAAPHNRDINFCIIDTIFAEQCQIYSNDKKTSYRLFETEKKLSYPLFPTFFENMSKNMPQEYNNHWMHGTYFDSSPVDTVAENKTLKRYTATELDTKPIYYLKIMARGEFMRMVLGKAIFKDNDGYYIIYAPIYYKDKNKKQDNE